MKHLTNNAMDRSWVLPPGIVRLILAMTVVVDHMTRLDLGLWAVEIFFVLSGYWVTTMYVRKYSAFSRPALAFYLSRYLRLFPIFALCQVGIVLACSRVHPELYESLTWLWALRLLPFVGSGSQLVLLGPAWSLDIEAQYYVAVPLLCGIFAHLKTRQRNWTLLGLGITSLVFPLTLKGVTSPWLFTFIGFFLFGMFLAYSAWKPSLTAARASVGLFLLSLILVVILPQTKGILLGGAHPINPVLFTHNGQFCVYLTCVIIPYIAASLQIKSSPRDRWLGNLAYPIYLFHWIPRTVIPAIHHWHSALLEGIVELVVVMIGSLLIERIIDQPFEAARKLYVESRFQKRDVASERRQSG